MSDVYGDAVRNVEFIELFCGIGGFAESITGLGRVEVAVDINLNALAVYRLNFSHPTLCKTIESIATVDSKSWAQRSWWMSPPCQPYSRRGNKKDLDDPRSQAFLNVLKLIEAHRPPELALENVPEFATSQSYLRLVEILDRAGYQFQQIVLCPTQFGITNRRSRFYLIASLAALTPWKQLNLKNELALIEPNHTRRPSDRTQLQLGLSCQIAYGNALHIIDESDPKLTSSCFTAAYGRSLVRSGSYLKTESGVRRFSPREILDQLGFGPSFELPDWPYRRLWPLVGNSLSIPVIRYIVSHLSSQKCVMTS